MEKMMNNTTTVVGINTHIKGSLEGDENLNVLGRIDGNISLTKTLTIEPEGIVVADVEAEQITVSGTVIGNITARDLVHITEQGKVVGDITTPRIVLVDGASFKGNIDMTNAEIEAPQNERNHFHGSPSSRIRLSRSMMESRIGRDSLTKDSRIGRGNKDFNAGKDPHAGREDRHARDAFSARILETHTRFRQQQPAAEPPAQREGAAPTADEDTKPKKAAANQGAPKQARPANEEAPVKAQEDEALEKEQEAVDTTESQNEAQEAGAEEKPAKTEVKRTRNLRRLPPEEEPEEASDLAQQAEAAAQAVASATRKQKEAEESQEGKGSAASTGKPPTAAGKKHRARRK